MIYPLIRPTLPGTNPTGKSNIANKNHFTPAQTAVPKRELSILAYPNGTTPDSEARYP